VLRRQSIKMFREAGAKLVVFAVAGCAGLLCLLAVCRMSGQTPATRAASAQESRIEGQVVSDADGQPLRRAHVTLRPLDANHPATGADADEHGNFALRDIVPGRYSLIAERDGYLATATAVREGLRMPTSFYVAGGDKITGVVFRLRPWAVLSGKITFDDGEPGVGVRVELYREYRVRGRHGYAEAAQTFANDQGQYRIFGLQPGAYFIAAVYNRAPIVAGAKDQHPVDNQGREMPVMGYSTAFFPETDKLSEALPVRVESGRELAGIDLSLRLVSKVKVGGMVTSGISGARLPTAGITLSHADASTDSGIAAPARAAFGHDGAFEIQDVVPGVYVVRFTASENGTSLVGHKVLIVSKDGEEEVELLASSPQPWQGAIKLEGTGTWPARAPRPRITLEPRSDGGDVVQTSMQSGSAIVFNCTVTIDEVYDVIVDNLPEDYYVSAVRVGGADVRRAGLAGSQASSNPFEVVLDSRGGIVSGRVFGAGGGLSGEVWSGANLALIPDPPGGRLQDYRGSSADEYGQFRIRGVAPGKYTLVAWLDDPPCDVYDPDGLEPCRYTGMQVTVDAAAEQRVELNMKAVPKR
jgi:hypothetical protein